MERCRLDIQKVTLWARWFKFRWSSQFLWHTYSHTCTSPEPTTNIILVIWDALKHTNVHTHTVHTHIPCTHYQYYISNLREYTHTCTVLHTLQIYTLDIPASHSHQDPGIRFQCMLTEVYMHIQIWELLKITVTTHSSWLPINVI